MEKSTVTINTVLRTGFHHVSSPLNQYLIKFAIELGAALRKTGKNKNVFVFLLLCSALALIMPKPAKSLAATH